MKRLSSKNIFSFLMLLVLIALGTISYQTYGVFGKYQQAVTHKTQFHFVTLVDETIKSLSQERMASANFMGSHGKEGKEALDEIREEVDTYIKELLAYIQKHPSFAIYTQRLNLIQKNLKKVRNGVDTLSSDYRDTFYTFYHQEIFHALSGILKIIAAKQNGLLKEYLDMFGVYTDLRGNQVLEDSGIVFVLKGHYRMEDEDLQIWDGLVMQDILPSVKRISDMPLRRELKATVSKQAYRNFGNSERVQILYGAENGKYRISAKAWMKQSDVKRQYVQMLQEKLLKAAHKKIDLTMQMWKSKLMQYAFFAMFALIILMVLLALYYNLTKDRKLFEDTLKDIEAVLDKEQQRELQHLIDHRDTNGIYRFLVDTIRAANQAKDLFLANMSHEIRTPLYNTPISKTKNKMLQYKKYQKGACYE